ncbi:hypothetical protein BG000_009448 [Podila horticola]|nr:hypothetical protein BG000_009448 [Podila horticola]
MEIQNIKVFWMGCLGLWTLSARTSGSPPSIFFGSDLGTFLNMEQIELETHSASLPVDQALVLQRCPNLRQYDLTSSEDHAMAIPRMTHILKNGHLLLLDTLTINKTVGFKDAELS